MNFPDNLKYTKDHEWILVEGDKGTIGITDYAQSELGDVVFVELPNVGQEYKSGDGFGTIEAVKAVSDLLAPVTGVVAEVNTALSAQPELVNSEPYSGGWMIKVKITNIADVNDLLGVAEYKSLIGK